jgi:microcystin-dependent protein
MSQVSDYNIANASGASVRSDLNAVFDAIKTLNSGGSDPSNTAAFMPYVDTADSNNLKIRNAANNGFTTVGSVDSANLGLLPRAGGTMTGQLLGDDGSGASSPAYAFDTNTDTGMFRSAANQVAFTCAGTKISHFSSAGLFITSTGSATTGIFLNDADNSAHISLKAPDVVSSNITYKLPASITNGGFLQTDGSGNLSFQIVAGVPSGSVFCMAVATVPSGYLECNGAAVSRTTYAALFAIIGTNYGNGDGSSTFNVPDLRGEFVRGFDNGRGVDNGRSINDPQSSANLSHGHSVSASVTDPGHNHATSLGSNRVFLVGGSQHVGFGGAGGYPGQDFSMSNANTGISVSISQNNAGGTEARPRNVAMMYIIKV